MAVAIRVLGLDDDLDAFGRIVLSSYRALDGHPADTGYEHELVDVRARVRHGLVLGAHDGDRPIGCVTYVNDPSSPYAEDLHDDEAGFRMLGVDTGAQGQGVGTSLVLACIERATELGRGAMFIHSGSWMTTAHRVYARLGFERVPARDWVVDGEGITLLALRRPIDASAQGA